MHIPEVGDYIGVESCLDLTPDVVDTRPSHGDGGGMNNRRRRRDTAEKKYPPPISCTQNLAPHMPWPWPWVMRKYYTSDGRLVIKEEKLNHRHQHFQAHRSNGRLLLNLVPLDEICQEDEINGLDEGVSDPTVNSDCYKYTGIGLNPCGGFAVAVPAFRRPPLHT